jgi:hypothetical protein
VKKNEFLEMRGACMLAGTRHHPCVVLQLYSLQLPLTHCHSSSSIASSIAAAAAFGRGGVIVVHYRKSVAYSNFVRLLF